MSWYQSLPLIFLLIIPILSEVLEETVEFQGNNMGQLRMMVEHSLDEGKSFSPRGTLTLQSMRSGSSSFPQNEISKKDLETLKNLCGRGGLYMLKVTTLLLQQDSPFIHRAVTDACKIVNSGLTDILTVHLDFRNQMVGISITAQDEDVMSRPNQNAAFKTKVNVQVMEAAPQPDTAAFIQKIEQEKLAKQRGETKDNRSFLAKYWMYIIPVVLIMAMNSANPEAQGGGGGR